MKAFSNHHRSHLYMWIIRFWHPHPHTLEISQIYVNITLLQQHLLTKPESVKTNGK